MVMTKSQKNREKYGPTVLKYLGNNKTVNNLRIVFVEKVPDDKRSYLVSDYILSCFLKEMFRTNGKNTRPLKILEGMCVDSWKTEKPTREFCWEWGRKNRKKHVADERQLNLFQ